VKVVVNSGGASPEHEVSLRSGNGIVDAADYVVWRKGLGTAYTQNDYNVWRAHFGQTAGSGSSTTASAAVPEPTSLVLLLLPTVAVCPLRRRAV